MCEREQNIWKYSYLDDNQIGRSKGEDLWGFQAISSYHVTLITAHILHKYLVILAKLREIIESLSSLIPTFA